MPGRSYSGPFAPLSTDEAEMRDNLKQHVSMLAGKIGERNLWRYDALKAAAEYIDRTFSAGGFSVASQIYRDSQTGREVRNIEAEIAGSGSTGELIVIGAHYDSVYGSPGANDNGSGVAALLEIARLLKSHKFDRTVRFVAFVNEEPPFYTTGEMGSMIYAKRARERGEQIAAMLSLETIGYYTDAPGSQHYPAPLSPFYPATGNFIGFVGNIGSRDLVRRTLQAFRESTRFPSEGGAFPGFIPGVGWSDHWSFWREGYSAIMVTDTALYRYPYYHAQDDAPDKLAYDPMARVVSGLARVVIDLAGRP